MRPDSIPVWDFKEMDYQHFGEGSVPKEFQRIDSKFYINSLKGIGDKIQFPLPPHRKPIYDFMFVTQGNTRRGKALTKYDVGPDDFFFLPAYQITQHEYVSSDIEGYFCQFSMDIFADWIPPNQLFRKFPFLQFIGNPVVKVNKRSRPYLNAILERLIKLLKEKDDTIRYNLAASYLMALFSEICHFTNAVEITRKDSAFLIAEQYKDILAKKIYDNQLVSDYANQLNVSPNHLNKCVKQVMGISAQDLLNRMVLLEAKVLLKQTDLTISQIAFQLSKKNHSDFSRFFKSKTGITPKQYRQN